jgi:predicted transcriptional regulator
MSEQELLVFQEIENRRYHHNPFRTNMVLNFTSKQVKISAIGKDDNIIVNQKTGEISGTHVITYKKVDNEEFIKIFSKNIALTFDLKSAGIKAFNVLIWTMQQKGINRDLISLDSFALGDFLKENELKLSIATFVRGLNELVKAKIIAKSRKKGDYYINPNFIFNGNRIAFTTAIEKEC